MSDYKEIESSVDMQEQSLILKALDAMGVKYELNVKMEQRWAWHNKAAEICIRKDSLPSDVRGFGDVGISKNEAGKYTCIGCSDNDSNYMDADIRKKIATDLVEQGMDYKDAIAEANEKQPKGKFASDLNKFFSKVQSGYVAQKRAKELRKQFGKIELSIKPKTRDLLNDEWVIEGKVSSSSLQRSGVNVPS